MKILGLVGWSGAGKTTLLTAMLPWLVARGLSVSTVKHAHHGFDIDRPGKDSHRHRAAGAREVMVASDSRWALLHETRGEPDGLADLLARLSPVDLVLVEGFKAQCRVKIEVFRPSLGKPALWPDDPDIVAVASDAPLEAGGRPLLDRAMLDLADPGLIAAWAWRHLTAFGPANVALQGAA